MALPKFQTNVLPLSLLQTQWASKLDPIINFLPNQGIILENIILSSSSVINHTLGRTLSGWQIVRQRGNATIFDNQDTNSNPGKTLLLNSSSGISVDILVF